MKCLQPDAAASEIRSHRDQTPAIELCSLYKTKVRHIKTQSASKSVLITSEMMEMNYQPSSAPPMQPLLNPKGEKKPPRRAVANDSKPSSTLLDNIKFDRKNKPQSRLPRNHTIQRRPILHPPIAAPFAGPDVQKVVYVSRKTPIMSAVKKVKKLLEQVEKRNLQREGVLGTGRRQTNIAAGVRGNIPQNKKKFLSKPLDVLSSKPPG